MIRTNLSSGIIALLVISALAGCDKQAATQGSSPTVEQQAASVSQTLQQQSQPIVAEAQKAVQQGADAVQADAQAATPSVQDQINAWIAKAKELMNSQNYEEAMKIAQQVLTQDPNSQEAKSILEQAKAAITKMAEQKLQQIGGGDLSQTTGLPNKIPGLGQ